MANEYAATITSARYQQNCETGKMDRCWTISVFPLTEDGVLADEACCVVETFALPYAARIAEARNLLQLVADHQPEAPETEGQDGKWAQCVWCDRTFLAAEAPKPPINGRGCCKACNDADNEW